MTQTLIAKHYIGQGLTGPFIVLPLVKMKYTAVSTKILRPHHWAFGAEV